MKRRLIFIIALFFSINLFCQSSQTIPGTQTQLEPEKKEEISWLKLAFKGFAYSAPKETKSSKWYVLGSIMVPLFKITDTTEAGMEVAAHILTGTAVGFSICYITEDGEGHKKRSVSFSPLTFLFSGEIKSGETKPDVILNTSWAATIGIDNDSFMFGIGRDFGKISGRKSRWFSLIGFGVSLRKSESSN
jgi:hypothetical protein